MKTKKENDVMRYQHQYLFILKFFIPCIATNKSY